jgi:allantoate deiminase
MSALGLRTWTDAFGNSYAELPGTEQLPAIGTGSHLDAVPNGGRFDGIVGVVAAAEVAELLVRHRIRMAHPIRLVAFAGEEGARFGQGCIGSKAAAGLWTGESMDRTVDAGGVTLPEAMLSVDLDPRDPAAAAWSMSEWAAFLELHVEQGTVLERAAAHIGIVTTVSGSTRLGLRINGVASHSGGTPMAGRRDALCAAAEIVLLAERLGNQSAHGDLRLTVGRLEVQPGSLTTIPGSVSLWVDIRGTSLADQRDAAATIVQACDGLERERGVRVEHRTIGEVVPTRLPDWPRQAVRDACAESGVPSIDLISGASHDSQLISAVTPTAIIFVPSRDGLSHVPQEYTDVADIARGTSILLQALMRVDRDDR